MLSEIWWVFYATHKWGYNTPLKIDYNAPVTHLFPAI